MGTAVLYFDGPLDAIALTQPTICPPAGIHQALRRLRYLALLVAG